MRTLVFIFMFFSFAMSAQTDTTYCIQLFATKNPKLIEPKMVAAFYEPCKIEKSGEWYRILYVCENYEEAVMYLHSWQRQHRKAFICAKETTVTNKLPYLVFSEN
jgi:phage-related protein